MTSGTSDALQSRRGPRHLDSIRAQVRLTQDLSSEGLGADQKGGGLPRPLWFSPLRLDQPSPQGVPGVAVAAPMVHDGVSVDTIVAGFRMS